MPLNNLSTTKEQANLGVRPSYRLPLTPWMGLQRAPTYQTFLYKRPSQRLITRLGSPVLTRDPAYLQRPSHQQ